ncbi:hypothetical protein EV179_002253 [Coemansia sp. RSA 487]|nr:hypothetical protein EV179_002253 [Coemansia sp. RSA 487]
MSIVAGYIRVVALLLCAVCAGLLQLQGAMAMNVTCAGFDSLCKITYDNVTPQALENIIITFKPDTQSQILASYCDALECRGSKVNVLNYNTLTLTGYISKEFCGQLQNSTHIKSVVEDSFNGVPLNMPALEPYSDLSFDSNKAAADLESSPDALSSSSAIGNVVNKLSLLAQISLVFVTAISVTLF